MKRVSLGRTKRGATLKGRGRRAAGEDVSTSTPASQSDSVSLTATLQKRAATDIDAHVGLRIRSLRLASKMSQAELGKQLGISFQQIQKYERGTNRVSASAMWVICQALGCTPNDLFPEIQDGEIKFAHRGLMHRGADELLDGYALLEASQQRAVLNLVEAMRFGPAG